ncbi:MAG: flavin reductase [Dehalococcoidia bacterium]|nr:flavin reductase [Dehalococcoidia bacterium]
MPDITPDEFRRVMGRLATGVTIVTTRAGDDVHGTTMSAVCSVSLQPQLVLVCVDHESDIQALIRESGVFAINILHEGQAGLAVELSHKGTPEQQAAHRLENLPHRNGATGAPLLEDSLAHVECRVEDTVEAGDHTIYVGSVVGAGVSPSADRPLLHYGGRYGSLSSDS